MNQETLKHFWNQSRYNPNKLCIQIASDIDCNYLFVEIYHDNKFVVHIHQELGIEQLIIVIPDKDYDNIIREINIDWFLKAIVIARGTLLSGDYDPEDKKLFIPNVGTLDKLQVIITSHLKYKYLISEVYYDGKYVALIHQEYGKSRPTLVFPEEDVPNVLREIDVNWFLKAVVIARDALVKDSTVPDIIKKLEEEGKPELP